MGSPGASTLNSSMPFRTRSHRIPSGLIWRISLAAVVTAVAILAFRMGVGVSQRPGVETGALATQLYYALGLFVLGGLDLGVPRGGPPLANALLWGCYFVAPLLTLGAVVEGLLRVWNPRWWRLKGLRDHVVVVGMGQIGMLYVEAVRRVDAKRRLLVVDVLADHVNVIAAQARHGAHFLIGDIRNHFTRDALNLGRAAGVVLVTGSDLVNLEAATDILEEYPRLEDRIVAHVADAALERTVVTPLAGGETGDGGPPHLSGRRLFNAHRIAADELVQRRLSIHFRETRLPDIVVLAGFGRFGQTILETLQDRAAGEFSTVLILDRVAERKKRQFDVQVGATAPYETVTLERDLSDPGTWDRADEIIREAGGDGSGGRSAIFVLGTDDDLLNLRTAMALRRRDPDAHIVVRCFNASSLTAQLSAEGRFDVFGVSSLLRDALSERHRTWFVSRS